MARKHYSNVFPVDMYKVGTRASSTSSIRVDSTRVPEETWTTEKEMKEDTKQRRECKRLDMVISNRVDRRPSRVVQPYCTMCCQSMRMDEGRRIYM